MSCCICPFTLLSDEGRFAALGAERQEEDSVRGTGLLVDEPGFRFSEGNGRVTHRQQATEQKAAVKAATAQEEEALAAAQAAREPDAKEGGQSACSDERQSESRVG